MAWRSRQQGRIKLGPEPTEQGPIALSRHLAAHPDRKSQVVKRSVAKYPPQEQGPLLGLEQAKKLLEPLPPFQAAGPFERIEAAWIGQQLDQTLVAGLSGAIALPIDSRPGLVQAGHLQGPGCAAGLPPARQRHAQTPGQVVLGQNRLTPVLPFKLEPLAPAMELS